MEDCAYSVSRIKQRPPSAAAEDRNSVEDCAYSVSRIKQRPPSAAAEDRNSSQTLNAAPPAWQRPPSAAAEDRNSLTSVGRSSTTLAAAAVRGGRGSQLGAAPG